MNNLRLLALSLLTLLLLASAATAETSRLSQDKSDRRSTIPNDPALASALRGTDLERLAVRHDGFNETLLTWSRLKLYELTGRESIPGQWPVYSLLSMMYQPELWMDAKILPVEHPKIAGELGFEGKWVSARQVATNPKVQQMINELNEAFGRQDELEKTTKKLNAVEQVRRFKNRPGILESTLQEGMDQAEIEKLVADNAAYRAALDARMKLKQQVNDEKAFATAASQLVRRVRLSQEIKDQFLILPDVESVSGDWITARPVPASGIQNASTEDFQDALRLAAASLDTQIARAFETGTVGTLGEATRKFLSLADSLTVYPREDWRAMLNMYVGHNPFTIAAVLYGLSACTYGLFMFFGRTGFKIAAATLLGLGFASHTTGEILRLLISGHMPVSNMFESITFCSWAALLVGCTWEAFTRRGMVGQFAAIFGLLALLAVSLMPLHDTRIHPLRAVLNSYWLNIHVTMMLISYGTFALSGFFAGGYLLKSLLGREALFGGTPVMTLDQMEGFAYRLVQLGWPLITVGIMLGAVWADTAWGRYWGWDPKETWALITWIVYTVYLHTRMVMGLRGRGSAFACALGFVAVMITWIGVSYLPWFSGGLHSYASPTG